MKQRRQPSNSNTGRVSMEARPIRSGAMSHTAREERGLGVEP